MAINKRDEGSKVNSNINVTPMVDVMLVLLIIFMVITPLAEQKINVDLAKTRTAVAMNNASKQNAIVIAVTRDSKVYLGQDQVSISSLGPKVAALLANQTNKTVYFRADARSHYGTLENAIDAVRPDDVETIGLLTENVKQNAPPAGGE